MRWLVAGLIASCVVASACGDDSTSDPAGGTEDGTATSAQGSSGATMPGGSSSGATNTTASTTDGTGSETTGAQGDRPNWHEDIAPLVAEHCVGCHSQGGIAPFPMETYDMTAPLAPVMAINTEQGTMPPWHALETDECTPPAAFKHDARLTPEQIQMFADWSDLGAPEGDPNDAVNIPPPPSLDLANPTTTVTMGGSIDVEAAGEQLDFFHCMSFDPGNTEDVFLDGFQVVPGNPLIAHHVLVFVDDQAESDGWTDGISLNCGGGAGLSYQPPLIGGWVPGSFPTETPQGVGIRVPAGARLVFNMHYHATTTSTETDSGTGIALRWSTDASQYVSDFRLIGAPGSGTVQTAPFLIPAGASDHEEVVEWAVPDLGSGVDVRVWSALNHMHKVGVDMKTSVVRASDDMCLVQTPNWDFEWQRLYEYDVPIGESFSLQNGDIVRVRCTYDNTLDNPAVVEALAELGMTQPQDVTLGEGTLDEMCLVGLGFAIGTP